MVSLLEKTRDNLPQKAPPATARAAPAATKSAAPPKPVSVAVDVEEDVRPSTAPARTTVAKGKAKAGTAAAKKVGASFIGRCLFCHCFSVVVSIDQSTV